jgi:hypothetical protein
MIHVYALLLIEEIYMVQHQNISTDPIKKVVIREIIYFQAWLPWFIFSSYVV